jgi:Undecaprenyl-phosphate galactose phosphotransferase WbaP
VPVGRLAVRQLLDFLGLWKRPVLIVGTGENARDAFKAIQGEFALGYEVVGFVEISADDANTPDFIEVNGLSLKKYLYDKSFPSLLAKLNQPQIVLAVDSMANKYAQTILHQLSLMSDNLHVIPSLRGLPLFGAEVSHFFSQEVVFLTVRNNLSRRSHQLIKRCFDLIVSLLAIVFLSPLLLVLIYLVKQDGGHAFYGHERIGKNGRTFKCLKFRSMHADSERMLKRILATDPVARAEWEKDFKLRNDPRITKVGKFLRKTSADELPQLFNVLRGEMSLVGPRPIVEAELERYGSASTYYLSVTPGITGLWQVSGRNDTSYRERVALDAWYAQNWSMWYDIAILFKTVAVVFGRKGAY